MLNEKMGPVQPWWRIRMMWLALGGPLLVVAASFATLALAIHGRDRALVETVAPHAEANTPAMQARNHAVATKR